MSSVAAAAAHNDNGVTSPPSSICQFVDTVAQRLTQRSSTKCYERITGPRRFRVTFLSNMNNGELMSAVSKVVNHKQGL